MCAYICTTIVHLVVHGVDTMSKKKSNGWAQERDRDRDRDRDRVRDRDRDTDRQRQRQRHTERPTETEKDSTHQHAAHQTALHCPRAGVSAAGL